MKQVSHYDMKYEAQTSKNPFIEVMKKRTDAELIEIITLKSEDYQPEAVAAAKEILKSRNLTSDEINLANDELEAKIQKSKITAAELLPWYLKVFYALFPFLGFAMALIYLSDQKTRKYQQAWRFALIPWLLLTSLISLAKGELSFILAAGIPFVVKNIIDRKKAKEREVE
jgi:hypothetical protein